MQTQARRPFCRTVIWAAIVFSLIFTVGCGTSGNGTGSTQTGGSTADISRPDSGNTADISDAVSGLEDRIEHFGWVLDYLENERDARLYEFEQGKLEEEQKEELVAELDQMILNMQTMKQLYVEQLAALQQ